MAEDENNTEENEQAEPSTVITETDTDLGYGSQLNKMMTYNFMEFASYVIKDRAIPDIDDGLKPVQRRILHTLKKVDDGKYHKVANVVGETMKYHPHGDSSIYGALVNIANKDFFIDKQGNFGNIITGDNASAARYIECRLTPLAREVLFNKETTSYVDSYDGRNQEPVALPAKVPVLLMQGAEGIAVGMATKVFPHNFNELLKAQIDILNDKRIRLYPDFPQGGFMDVSQYDNGHGKVKVRAKIEKINKNTLVITEIPAGTTTESLIQNIEDAVKNGKIKLSSINDFTGENVEIELKVSRGIDADRTMEALYAFTNCEISLSSNITVIKNNRPIILTVPEVLYHNTQKLVDFLRWELEIEENKLNERFHEKTLEQIFIENRIYKRIEDCTEEDAVYDAVYAGLEPFNDQFRRDVTREDIDRLLRIPIRRISLFDINKNRKELDDILKALEEVRYNLKHLKEYTINFIKDLLKKYGKAYPRRTQIKELEQVDAKEIALSNTKVGLDRKGGYVGKSVSGADAFKCTEFDKIVVLHKDGKFKVMNIPDKLFVGRFYEAFVVNKDQVYSIVYRDSKTGLCYHKRCKIDRFILEKEYNLCPPKCKIELFETNYGIVLECELENTARSKDQKAELIFEDIPIRGTTAKGFKTASRKIEKFLKLKRGTEKKPSDSEEDNNSEEDEEENKKREWGWKSKTPVSYIAREEIELVEELETLEEVEEKELVYIPESKQKAIEEARKAAEQNKEIPNEAQEESIIEEASAKKAEEPAEKAPEEEEKVTEEATAEKEVEPNEEISDLVTEEKKKEKVEEKKKKNSKKKEKTPPPQEAEEKEESKEEVKPEIEEIPPSEEQAEFNLPEETGQRRYLIDEDNPFKLEP